MAKVNKKEIEEKNILESVFSSEREDVDVDASYDETRSGWATEKGAYSFIAAKDADTPLLTRKVRIAEPSFVPTGDYLKADPVFIER